MTVPELRRAGGRTESPLPALETENLTFSYGAVKAIDGISLSLEPAQAVGVVGPNGSGKSTFLRVIAGHLPSAAGSARVMGHSVLGWLPSRIARLGVGFLHQHPRLFEALTCHENLLCAGTQRPRDSWIDWLIEQVEMTPYMSSFPEILSHGQARLLQVARTLAPEPQLALLDEPASGVNPRIRGIMSKLIGEVVSSGATVVVVEHDMAFVRSVCQRLIVIDSGRVIADGEPDEVLTRTEVVNAYFG